jgi:ADP-heptose:LPS heptosyltransferase
MSDMKRVLVIKLGALGDVVIATSVVRRIQLSYPGCEIWLLTAEDFAGLFEDWPGLHVHATPRRGLRHMLQLLRWLRAQRFDAIFDLQSNDRSALLCAFSGARMRVGNHPRYPYTHHPATRHAKEEPGFARLQLMLQAAGLPEAEARPYIPAGDPERRLVREWLQQQALQDARFVLMHAGASPRWPAKRWPHYAPLAAALEQRGLRVVWLGAAADRAINGELARTAGIDATDRFSIGALAELARHARFAVTNDSGPMHVLAAAGIPVYAFFGPTDWRRSHALGQRDRVLLNPRPCAACDRADRARATDHSCLPGITAAEVLARLERDGLLQPTPATAR